MFDHLEAGKTLDQLVVPHSRRPLLIKMSEVVPEHVQWLWPDRIPYGKVTVLDGDPGDGASETRSVAQGVGVVTYSFSHRFPALIYLDSMSAAMTSCGAEGGESEDATEARDIRDNIDLSSRGIVFLQRASIVETGAGSGAVTSHPIGSR